MFLFRFIALGFAVTLSSVLFIQVGKKQELNAKVPTINMAWGHARGPGSSRSGEAPRRFHSQRGPGGSNDRPG